MYYHHDNPNLLDPFSLLLTYDCAHPSAHFDMIPQGDFASGPLTTPAYQRVL
jgi:hypothetical protein